MATVPNLVITSLRGGMNDTLPPMLLPEDQCQKAENVEFFFSALGERRKGCEPIDITSASLSDEFLIAHLSVDASPVSLTLPDLWAVGATPPTTTSVARRDSGGSWHTVSPDNAFAPTAPDVFQTRTQALHNKLFFAYLAATPVNRFHVWDGTYLRATGLAAPVAAPATVDEGVGAYATVRYFRVRYIEKSGSTVLRRSEPSAVTTFTPSGAGAGARLTKPAALGEHETHWEVEASADDATFYVIATVVVGTTTYDDTTASPASYANSPLSETSGDYNLLPPARYVVADADRLVLGGNWYTSDQDSRIYWTPVFNSFGVGNDERLPESINNTIDLDPGESGAFTGLSQAANGSIFAFKESAIYKLVRTGDLDRAYDVVSITKAHGAIKGSIVSAIDEKGQSCIYFLDPLVGPSRIGAAGLQIIQGLRNTWKRVNQQATNVVCHGVYYPDKQQVHWWVAADEANTPSLKLVLQLSEIMVDSEGTTRGWSLATGRITQAYCSCTMTEFVSENDTLRLSQRPFIGLSTPDFIQRTDNGDVDTDAEVSYTATIKTRAYILGGILNRVGVMALGFIATANAAVTNFVVRVFKDFDEAVLLQIGTDLVPTATEGYVIRLFPDSVNMSEATSLEFEFTDAPYRPETT